MADIALFPLQSVLFPGALLPLRIFETRYVDMVGQCMREDREFGVIRILEGREAGSPVSVATVGTSARIVDFETLEDGLLGLLCRGERRFQIQERSAQPDGLNRAQISWLDEPPAQVLPQKYQTLVPVLQSVLTRLGRVGQFVRPHYQDAGWVSYRLAEFLPLSAEAQQHLLELTDPLQRLALLAPLIEPAEPASDC